MKRILRLASIRMLMLRATLAALALGAASCAEPKAAAAAVAPFPRSWLVAAPREGPAEKLYWSDERLGKERVQPVAAERREEAVAALLDRPAKALTAVQAKRLLGRAYRGGRGLHPLLVRGVKSNGNGAFDAQAAGDVVVVIYSYLGYDPNPQAWPVVVMLDKPVRHPQVYVTSHGAL